MPINISFDSSLTQNEADALRALLGTLRPARGGVVGNIHPTYVGEQVSEQFQPVVVTKGEWSDPVQDQTLTLSPDDVGSTVSLVNGEIHVAAPPPPPSTDLDSDGKEWDEAIHASTRTKTADGRWKKKRGEGTRGTRVVAPDGSERSTEQIETYVELPSDSTSEQVAEAFAAVSIPAPPAPPPPPSDGLPTFPETVKICSSLGKGVYEKVFTDMAVKSILDLRDDAVRTLFFENETILVARLEKGV